MASFYTGPLGVLMLSHHERLPSAADGNRYSQPQRDSVQRIKEKPGTLGPRRGVSVNAHPRA